MIAQPCPEAQDLTPSRSPPLENRIGRKAKLIAQSRERFAMPRAKIDDKLNRWMASKRI
jgi:hypothetical protein